MTTFFALGRTTVLTGLLAWGLLSNLYAASAPQPSREWVPLVSPQAQPRSPQSSLQRSDTEIRVATSISGLWLQRRTAAGRAICNSSSGFDSLDIPDFSHLHDVGKPKLPAKTYLLPIPPGVTPRVQFIPLQTTLLKDVQIVPMQELPPDVYPEPPPAPFAMSDAVYAGNELYPADPVVATEVIGIRDQTLLRIVVAPIQVRPSDASAEITQEYELLITWDTPSTQAEMPSSSGLPIYMILTPDLFATNSTLLTLAEWKKRKGLDVRLVKTSDINPNGAPTNGEIVAYMRALSASNYPTYLLIAGNYTPTNGVAGAYFNSSTEDYYGYTDLDIACRTSTDFFPDLYYGRLPATSQVELATMVGKILLMDRTPPASSMYQKVCVAGQIQDSDDHDQVADRLFCETADSIACYFEANTGGTPYSCLRAIVNPDGMTATGKWNESSILWNGTEMIGDRIYTQFVSVATAQSRINAQVNSGISLLQHRDHGYVNGVGWADPYYVYTHVRALTNQNNQPVVFSINCNSGMYNFPNNFATAWLSKQNGGAYAVFAPVDTSYSWLNDWLTHGFYAAFLDDYISGHNASVSPDWPKNLPSPSGGYGTAGSAKKLGQILNFGKFYMAEKYYADATTFRLFHLFGDPESQLRLKTPQTPVVTHPAAVQISASAVTVSVSVANATVCLYSSAYGIQAVASPVDGNAIFPLAVSNSGILYVTVTGQDVRPYEGQISVYRGDGLFSFKATPLNASVMLRWSDPRESGMATALVRVRADTSDYPPSADAGRLAYEGENPSFLDTGLTNNTPYYYSIWVTDDGVNFIEP